MGKGTVRAGFSLIELLLVIAIIVLLSALGLAAIQRARHTALRADCSNHLRQIGLGLHQYHDTQRVLPPGCSYKDGKDPYPFLAWSARLLPFLEQSGLWSETERAFATNKRFTHNPPHVGLGTVLVVYTCRADTRTLAVSEQGKALTAYLGVEGTNQFKEDGMLFLDSSIRFSDATDGMSNTLLVGERPPSADLVLGWWYAGEGQGKDGSADSVLGVKERNVKTYARDCRSGPYEFGPGNLNNQCDAFHFWSMHIGGAHFLMADGAVQFINYSAAPIMPALATRSNGESVTLP